VIIIIILPKQKKFKKELEGRRMFNPMPEALSYVESNRQKYGSRIRTGRIFRLVLIAVVY
jgi:hypothetical protein